MLELLAIFADEDFGGVEVELVIDREPYIALIKRLAVKDKLDFDTAKLLINEYKKLREGNKSC